VDLIWAAFLIDRTVFGPHSHEALAS
jgi:hypothetical protein